MIARKAIVREPGKRFSRCISTHPAVHTVDTELARKQHRVYAGTLKDLGLDVVQLDRDDDNADSCFVEDTAVVHDGRAIVCRPAEESRRAEVAAVEKALSEHVTIRRTTAPATVEGGDVLHLRDRLVCGLTRRTNSDGVRQLTDWLRVRVDTVTDPSIMHLKSHVSYIDDRTILVTERYADDPAFGEVERLVVPRGEAYAANVVSVSGTVVMPAGFPETERVLREGGFDVISLEMTEFPKCDGAMTCLSILL